MAFIGDVVVALKANTTDFTRGIKRADMRLQKFQKSLFGLKSAMFAFAGAYGLKRVSSGFLEVASSFEAMEIKLDTLTKGKGTETLERINAWALEMPVNTQEAVAAFTRMQAMGLDPTIDKMQTLVDVSSIFGDEALGRVSLALGQMSSLGKINAQDLNQLAQVGINARKMLKDAFDMSVEEIQRSGMDIQEVIEVIWQGLDANFSGAAKKSMTSWRGLMATFKSYLVEFQRYVMKSGVFQALKEQIMEVNAVLKQMFDSGEMERVALEWAIAVQKGFKRVVQAIDILRLSFNGLSQTFNLIKRVVQDIQFASVTSAISDTSEEIQSMSPYMRKVNELMGGWTDEMKKANPALYRFQLTLHEDNKELKKLEKNLKLPSLSNVGRNTAVLVEHYEHLNKRLEEANEAMPILLKSMNVTDDQSMALANTMVQLTDAIVDAQGDLKTLEERLKRQVAAAKAAKKEIADLRKEFEKFEDMRWGPKGDKAIKAEELFPAWWELQEAVNQGLGLWEPVQAEVESVNDSIYSMQHVYEDVASRIRDVMAVAFKQIAEDGKVSMDTVGDAVVDLGAQIAANSIMSGNYYGAAAGGAMMVVGSMMGSGDGDERIAAYDRWVKSIQDLTDSIDLSLIHI